MSKNKIETEYEIAKEKLSHKNILEKTEIPELGPLQTLQSDEATDVRALYKGVDLNGCSLK